MVDEDIKNVDDRNIILMTHVVTHPQFVVPTPHRIFDFLMHLLGRKILIIFMRNILLNIVLWVMFIFEKN